MAPKHVAKNVIKSGVEWTPVHLLVQSEKDDNTMTEEKLKKVREIMPKDPVPNLVIPPDEVQPEWYMKDWICFIYHPFDIRMSFPWSKLTRDFLAVSKASPSQLMPTVWRILTSLDAIEAKHRLGIDIHTLCYAYATKKFHGARITLIVRKKREALIWNITEIHDIGWRGEFFFGEKSTLGGEEDTKRLFDQWTTDGGIDDQRYDVVGKVVADKIYALPPEDMIFPNCTGREIPNCSHVNVEEFMKKHNKAETKKESSETYRTRSNVGRTGSKATGKKPMAGLKEGGDSLNPLQVEVEEVESDDDDGEQPPTS